MRRPSAEAAITECERKCGMNTDRVMLSEEYAGRIQRLHEEKIRINQAKLAAFGSIDFDDHGYVYFPAFDFVPVTHEDGRVYGMKNIGDNFKKILHEMPLYFNPDSALAGCWPGALDRWMDIGFRPENEPVHLKKTWEEYDIWQHGCGSMNHLCPDMRIGLSLGWKGLLEKVRFYRQVNCTEDTSFYDGEEALLSGVLDWIDRHVKEAEKRAEESEGRRREYYRKIAQVNRKLLNDKPETMLEACQFLAHFQTIDRMYFLGGALGQMDELLRPYYEKDMAEGRITEEEAVWYLASLLFQDTHYGQVGGLTPDGKKEVTSRLSYLFLEATHYLKIPCNIALRVHDRMDETLLYRSLEYNMEDGTGFAYSCSRGCEEGFAKNGFPMELARMRIKAGCNWTAIPGEEYPLQDVTRVNMPMALVKALEDVRQDRGITLEAVWNRFIHHFTVMLDCIREGYDWHYAHVSEDKPEIVLNLFMHGPIERGVNCAAGGVDLLHFNIDAIGLATVADSFAAMEIRIEQQKVLTWEQLFDALDHNYEGNEKIRLMLKNIDRLGAPDSAAMKWAEQIRDYFVSYCKSNPTPKFHLPLIPGMFSHGDIVAYGERLPATPNGRKAGEPISHSNEPDPGFAQGIHTYSPTLKATAVARLQPGYGNSSPLHLDIDDSLIRKNGGIRALMALIHAHERMGGTLINLNCLTKERLLKAHENPESDPDLVVRVTGFSAFFASLSRQYRQQVVDRFLE